jgi:hypothetical protein
MTIDVEKLGAEMKADARKSVAWILLLTVVTIGAGAAFGYFVASRPISPRVIIIQQALTNR